MMFSEVYLIATFILLGQGCGQLSLSSSATANAISNGTSSSTITDTTTSIVGNQLNASALATSTANSSTTQSTSVSTTDYLDIQDLNSSQIDKMETASVPPTRQIPVSYKEENIECNTSIYDIVSSTPQLSILKQILDVEENFIANLTQPDFIATFLAPVNSAWNKIADQFQATIEQLAGDPLTGDVLKYHIIPDVAFMSCELRDGEKFNSALLGEEIEVDISQSDNAIRFKNSFGELANIVVADVETCEAVVYLIDLVLVPAF